MIVQHPVDTDCIFCKIITGIIPCTKIYENEQVFAFLDIAPVSKGHTLLVPKAHYKTLLDLPDGYGEAIVSSMKKIAFAIQKATKADGFNCLQNNFQAAGQIIFHAHWHIIPRFEQDGLANWGECKYNDIKEMNKLALAIQQELV